MLSSGVFPVHPPPISHRYDARSGPLPDFRGPICTATMYAVIFTSQQSAHTDGYAEMNAAAAEEARTIDGFLFEESSRQPDGFGVSVSYWRDLEAIGRWRNNTLHRVAKEKGRSGWFDHYSIRICKVESEHIVNLNKKP